MHKWGASYLLLYYVFGVSRTYFWTSMLCCCNIYSRLAACSSRQDVGLLSEQPVFESRLGLPFIFPVGLKIECLALPVTLLDGMQLGCLCSLKNVSENILRVNRVSEKNNTWDNDVEKRNWLGHYLAVIRYWEIEGKRGRWRRRMQFFDTIKEDKSHIKREAQEWGK